jgi:hypothetical protein
VAVQEENKIFFNHGLPRMNTDFFDRINGIYWKEIDHKTLNMRIFWSRWSQRILFATEHPFDPPKADSGQAPNTEAVAVAAWASMWISYLGFAQNFIFVPAQTSFPCILSDARNHKKTAD